MLEETNHNIFWLKILGMPHYLVEKLYNAGLDSLNKLSYSRREDLLKKGFSEAEVASIIDKVEKFNWKNAKRVKLFYDRNKETLRAAGLRNLREIKKSSVSDLVKILKLPVKNATRIKKTLDSVIVEKNYGIRIGPSGVYDVRNNLNDLTGSEWSYFINSVHETYYPTTGPEGYAHDLRRRHPSPKPPQLMRDIIKFFTKENAWVLDPFVGVGGTLLGAALCNRNAIGIDISQEYLDIYKEVCKRLKLREYLTIHDDARNISKYKAITSRKFDLILTDPPYCKMMAKEKTGEKKKKGLGAATPFTKLKTDIGNLEYDDFLIELKKIIRQCVKYLKNNGYLVVFIKDLQPSEDLQPTKDKTHVLHADVILKLSEIENLRYRGYKIWYDKTVGLYPFGYPFAFVPHQLHQFILIFRKEKVAPKKLREERA